MFRLNPSGHSSTYVIIFKETPPLTDFAPVIRRYPVEEIKALDVDGDGAEECLVELYTEEYSLHIDDTLEGLNKYNPILIHEAYLTAISITNIERPEILEYIIEGHIDPSIEIRGFHGSCRGDPDIYRFIAKHYSPYIKDAPIRFEDTYINITLPKKLRNIKASSWTDIAKHLDAVTEMIIYKKLPSEAYILLFSQWIPFEMEEEEFKLEHPRFDGDAKIIYNDFQVAVEHYANLNAIEKLSEIMLR